MCSLNGNHAPKYIKVVCSDCGNHAPKHINVISSGMSDSEDDEFSLGQFSDCDSDEEFLLHEHNDDDDENMINFPEDEDEEGADVDSEDELGDLDEHPDTNVIRYRKNVPFSPQVSDYEDPGEFLKPDFGVTMESTALEILQKFLDPEILDEIVLQTNVYVQQQRRANRNTMKDWSPVNGEEIWQFFSLVMMMGLVIKPEIKDYWSTDSMFCTPFFGQVMSRNRFESILRGFHLVDNDTVPPNNKDRYIKFGSFMDKLFQNFRKAINLGSFLTVDETLLSFKGRLSFKQYLKDKRARFGMKLYLLCDSASRFVLKALPYQGRTTKIENSSWIQELGFGGATVMTLLHGYFNKFHRITIDNWFVSPILALRLKQLGTYILGTVQKRRKLMPKWTDKLAKGQVATYSSSDILVERWSDRREVIMLNTFMGHRMEEITTTNPNNNREKPSTVLVYNATMGAVDNVDRVSKPFTSVRKSFKWYRKVFFYFLDIAIYNSHIIHSSFRPTKEHSSYKDFVRIIIKEILEKYPPQRLSLGRKSNTQSERRIGTHFPEKMLEDNVSVFRDCHLCCLEGKRRTTAFRCETCLKFFCIKSTDSCFKRFHTLSKLPVKRKRSNANASSASTSQSIMYQSVPRSETDSEIGLGFGEANEVRFQEADFESNVVVMEEEEELFSI
ncbi:piggyBac transposable element-derived protein 4-like [Folsomia candida]|uniref:piggyBac transposable element-derived protein 4-like n=1 Tax=Folsomia candida TaxID=158441 RepID=UPI000B8EEF89|nr:piggyBac transposable element-derived protein 4-like [Folsomia candida]